MLIHTHWCPLLKERLAKVMFCPTKCGKLHIRQLNLKIAYTTAAVLAGIVSKLCERFDPFMDTSNKQSRIETTKKKH